VCELLHKFTGDIYNLFNRSYRLLSSECLRRQTHRHTHTMDKNNLRNQSCASLTNKQLASFQATGLKDKINEICYTFKNSCKTCYIIIL